MGGLKLCFEKKAENPFCILEHPFRLHTIEEVCYYLYSNLYTLEPDIMDEKLFLWLERELSLEDLAGELRKIEPFEERIIAILMYADYCDQEELDRIQYLLGGLKSQNKEERIRLRADHYLHSKKYYAAILEYNKLLNILENKEQEQILNNIGCAYTKLFLYREAAEYFYSAYQCNNNKTILKNYLFAAYFLYPESEFLNILDEMGLDDSVIEKIKSRVNLALQEADRSIWMREIELASKDKNEGELGHYIKKLEKIVMNWKQDYIHETS